MSQRDVDQNRVSRLHIISSNNKKFRQSPDQGLLSWFPYPIFPLKAQSCVLSFLALSVLLLFFSEDIYDI